MKTMTAFEAKKRFGELLDRVVAVRRSLSPGMISRSPGLFPKVAGIWKMFGEPLTIFSLYGKG